MLELPKPPSFSFVRGKRYAIDDKPMTYLRKDGIHHVFKGNGGWLATWTDAQLVGVKVTGKGG